MLRLTSRRIEHICSYCRPIHVIVSSRDRCMLCSRLSLVPSKTLSTRKQLTTLRSFPQAPCARNKYYSRSTFDMERAYITLNLIHTLSHRHAHASLSTYSLNLKHLITCSLRAILNCTLTFHISTKISLASYSAEMLLTQPRQ